MKSKLQSETLTEGIRIRVFPDYAAEKSDPKRGEYLFTYSVIITNESDTQVKLLSRRWLIIDGNGKREEVEGPGVIGQTPVIEPGAEFEYSSFCPLKTTWGTMEGSYEMQRGDGVTFQAAIGRFYLTASQSN